MAITVYTKPACVQCNATYCALDKAGIEYDVIDITENAQARESQCPCQAAEWSAPGAWRVNSLPSRRRAHKTSTCLRATARRARV